MSHSSDRVAAKAGRRASATNSYQKSQVTRQKIVDAAAKVIAREGYARASIARITEEAGIGSGLFYYYFDSKDDLLNQVLPALGEQMIEFIAERLQHQIAGIEREVASFLAYFDFLKERPEFYRLFCEAEVYCPIAYEAHISLIINNYVRWLNRQRAAGNLEIAESEITPLAYALIGVRTYLTKLLFNAPRRQRPEDFVPMYRRMLAGIFRS